MIDRLKVIMEKEGLNPSQLADRLHIQRSGLSHILSGRNNPSLDFVKKVLTEFPQYDIGWLIFGDTDVNINVYKRNINVNSGVYKCEHTKELSLFDNSNNSHIYSSLKQSQNNVDSPVQEKFLKQNNENKKIVDYSMNQPQDNASKSNNSSMVYTDLPSSETETGKKTANHDKTSTKQLVTVIMVYDNHTFDELRKE